MLSGSLQRPSRPQLERRDRVVVPLIAMVWRRDAGLPSSRNPSKGKQRFGAHSLHQRIADPHRGRMHQHHTCCEGRNLFIPFPQNSILLSFSFASSRFPAATGPPRMQAHPFIACFSGTGFELALVAEGNHANRIPSIRAPAWPTIDSAGTSLLLPSDESPS